MAMDKVYAKKELLSFKDLFLEIHLLGGGDWWNECLNWGN